MILFGIAVPALLGQLMVGLVNGSFYAVLSLGLAVIFGLLNVVNFAHGVMFMLGAVVTWVAHQELGIGYWSMLLLAPALLFAMGVATERTMLRRIYRLDPIYGLLLTLGLTLLIEGVLKFCYGVSGMPYSPPAVLAGSTNLGFMLLPNYRAWVVGASLFTCGLTWVLIERTRLGSYLRAGTENPRLLEAFGINVPLMITLTYGFGVALAGLAGVLAAPVLQVSPLMGQNLIIVVFAVVVIGGMGSVLGTVLAGISLGVVEGIVKLLYPQAASLVVFLVMIVVLLLRPAGALGKVK